MRIAMLSVHSCPLGRLGTRDTGGMSVYIIELARELGKRGHQVDVFTRAHNPEHETVMSLGENARLIHLQAGGEGHIDKLALYVYLPDFTCEIERFRRENGLRYDIIFSHYWLSGWVGRFVQGWWNIPHVIMFHTVGAIKNALGIGQEEPELRLETEKYLTGCCHRIIAPTERERGDLAHHYGACPEMVSVIPCGVNLNVFQPRDKIWAKEQLGLDRTKRIALFVGRIEPLKGVDKLLMSLPYIKSPELRTIIVGGDEASRSEIERLQALVQKLGLGNRVEFLGLVEQSRLPLFYSAADVCVVPSYYESFGLVALESLACGTPVVATDVGGMKDIVRPGETGYILRDNSPRRLAVKIGRVLARPSTAAGPDLIRRSVARFGWAYTAERIIDEFDSLVSGYRAG
ncbi:MAG: glycosyltransferase [Chloroflexi bacterium]|nr:glycosyltransferase [Chloroflexota bacterium]